MADSTRLTIIAELKDMLTGPLRKVKKAIDDLDAKAAQHGRNQASRERDRAAAARAAAKAADKNAYRFSRERREFNARAREEGFLLNKRKRWYDKDTGRFMTTKQTQYIAAYAKKQRDALPMAERFADRITMTTARFTQSQAKANRFARSMTNLATTFGVASTQASAWGTRMGRIFANLPNQANRAATAVAGAMSKIYAHQAKFQSGLNKAYGYGVGLPALGVGAYAAKEGMARLNTFEGSDVRLKVLDFEPGERKDFQKQVDEMVRGTLVTLPQGMGIATKLLASIDPKDFEDRMQTVIDAASVFSPDDVDGLATVFTQVQQKGFLTGEEANQFNERLVPVIKLLSEDLGKSDAEIRDMMEKRQITAEMVWEAVGPAVEGGAQAMGETFLGSWGMLKAAVGRSGQYFLEGMSQELEQILKLLTATLDQLAPFFRNLGESLGRGLTGALEQVPKIGEALAILDYPLRSLFSTIGDILPELVHGFANWLKLANLVVIPMIAITTVLLQLAEHTLPILIPALAAFVHIIGFFLHLIVAKKIIGGLALAFRWLFDEVKKLPLLGKFFSQINILTGLKNIGAAVITWAKALPGQVGLAIFGAVRAIPAGLGLIFQGIGMVLLGLGGRIKALLGWFGKFTVVGRVAAVFTGLWAALGGGAGILTALKTGILGLFNLLRVIPGIGWIITGISAVIAVAMNWGRISDWVREKWTGLVDAVQNRWARFKMWWVRLAEDLVAPFIAVRDGVAKQWREMKAGAERAVEGFISPFREGIFAPLRAAIVNPIAAVVAGAQGLWLNLKQGANAAKDWLLAPFVEIGHDIIAFLDSFDGGAGAAIINFFAPFQSAIDWVTGLKDAIADFVDSAITKLELLGEIWSNNPITKASDWINDKGAWLGDKLGLREKQNPAETADVAAGAMAAGAANVDTSGGATAGGRTFSTTGAAGRVDDNGAPTGLGYATMDSVNEQLTSGPDPVNRGPLATATGADPTNGAPLLRSAAEVQAKGQVVDFMVGQLRNMGISQEQITRMTEYLVPIRTQAEWAAKGIYQPAFAAVLDKGRALTEDEVGVVINTVRGGLNNPQLSGAEPDYHTGVAPGFFTGGYTGDYGTHEIAGVVHGQEYVLNAYATRRLEANTPGAAAYINDHGALPPVAASAPALTYAPNVQITVGSESQGEDVRAAIRAELARQAREMNRHYMTTSARGAR